MKINVAGMLEMLDIEDGVGCVDLEDSCACFSFPISPGGFLADPDFLRQGFLCFFARFPHCSDKDFCAA